MVSPYCPVTGILQSRVVPSVEPLLESTFITKILVSTLIPTGAARFAMLSLFNTSVLDEVECDASENPRRVKHVVPDEDPYNVNVSP